MATPRMRTAEFFAGMGLVRKAIEEVGGEVVFANDIEPAKRALYVANFGDEEFQLGDIRDIAGADVPDVELATASFPCTDLSLAGNRAGLNGEESGMFWEFARVLEEMGPRKPPVVLLENVPSFATSNGGRDLAQALGKLNELGYACDLLVVNAQAFTPQSRPRLFIVGEQGVARPSRTFEPSELRPEWVARLVERYPDIAFNFSDLRPPEGTGGALSDVVERLPSDDPRWWDEERVARFREGMSELQRDRLSRLIASPQLRWATAYRRTRNGRAVWEVRRDDISGCLRTARGGSSKQALVEAGKGTLRVRWMTPREYARLQGVDDDFDLEAATVSQALFALGDAVCVPAVVWVLRNAVLPAWRRASETRNLALASV